VSADSQLVHPYTGNYHESIASLGESSLIAQIREWLGDASPAAPRGIGDDCAVLERPSCEAQELVTADPVIYNKHFDDTLSPEQVARKLIRRNLSDIAAMGGSPRYAINSLALDPSVSIEWIRRFHLQLAADALEFRLEISGGDVSSCSGFLGAFMTLSGNAQPNAALLRHRSKAGSRLYVSGSLGGSRMGKHHAFTPRLAEGQWLAESGLCLSCTDLSDGLGKDWSSLLRPWQSCVIDCKLIPLATQACASSRSSGRSALHHAFNDGEDFELYFALDPSAEAASFEREWTLRFDTALSCIGSVAESDSRVSQLILENADPGLQATGYEHLG